MSEGRDIKIKRLYMRSIRRGIKEMDIILGQFAQNTLPSLPDADLATYDLLLHENDHDLYAWVTGAGQSPDKFGALIAVIAENITPIKR